MDREPTYKDYVIPELVQKFEEWCRLNSTDFYSTGISSAHLVMNALMQHTYEGTWKRDKITVKQAWEDAMENTGHSGCSASCVAIVVANYSPRGSEFKEWCKKEDVVMVAWDSHEKKRGKKK